MTTKKTTGAEPSQALVPRTVEGWALFQSPDGYWIKDLELAARAGKEPARNIRPVIEGVIGDGLARVVGDGAADVLSKLGTTPAEHAELCGARGACATIRAEKSMAEGTPPGASDVAGVVILVSRTIPKAKRDAVCWRALAQRRRLTTANDNGGGALRMVGGAS